MKKLIKEIPKLDFYSLLIFIILIFVYNKFPQITLFSKLNELYLANYFNKDRLSLIANITFILIGIYATITSVFGSSRSMATSRLAEKDLTKDFIKYIALAIISSLLLVVYIIFLDCKRVYILLFLIIWMFENLIRFLVIILLMYNYNVKTAKKVDLEEQNRYEKLMDIFTEISIELKRKK